MKGDTNMEEKIVAVLNEMSEYLSIAQMKKLQEVKLLQKMKWRKQIYQMKNF